MPEFMPGEDDFSVFKETLAPEDHCHGSHHGLTDLYSEWRDVLEKAFKEERFFEATWTSKKELHTGTIVRRPEYIIVEATVYCDEDDELVTDAMWEMCKPDNELYERLSQNNELIEKIMDTCMDMGQPILGDSGFRSSLKLPKRDDLDVCLSYMDIVVGEADTKSQENFGRLIELIKWTTMDPTIEK